MAAHLFVLYCGLWSYITPPVALAAFAAAGIAEADPMRTGFTSMRLGIAKYFLPFFFVISPALILHGESLFETLYTIATCAIGLIFISAAFEGYIWIIGRITTASKIIFFISGFLISLPGSFTDLIGIIPAIIVIVALSIGRAAKLSRASP